MKSFFLTFTYLLLALCTYAQVDKKAEKAILKLADQEFEQAHYPQALIQYKEALTINPSNALTSYKLGYCYLKSSEKFKALTYFENAYKLNPTVTKDILFMIARGYQYNERFNPAIEYYVKFKKTLTDKDASTLGEEADKKIHECERAKEYMKNPKKISIENLGSTINSTAHDYSPAVSLDEHTLIFTSRREGATGDETDMNGLPYEDIYISHIKDGKWTVPVNMKEINTPSHEATVSLSPDGMELVIYKPTGNGDLYFSNLAVDGQWTVPEKFPDIISAPESNELHATFSPDRKTMFFVSNRNGGKGGLDIYETHLTSNETWSKPTNLGPTINTPGNEEGPFIDIDGKTLYFSSTMHETMGDYDIFRSVYDSTSRTWSKPENLGYPINSASDDIFFVLSGDGKYAYFNSAKYENGIGGEDIYRFKLPETFNNEKRRLLMQRAIGLKNEDGHIIYPPVIRGSTIDIQSSLSVADVKISLFDSTGNTLYTTTSDKSGNFEILPRSSDFGVMELVCEHPLYRRKTKSIVIPKASTTEILVSADMILEPLTDTVHTLPKVTPVNLASEQSEVIQKKNTEHHQVAESKPVQKIESTDSDIHLHESKTEHHIVHPTPTPTIVEKPKPVETKPTAMPSTPSPKVASTTTGNFIDGTVRTLDNKPIEGASVELSTSKGVKISQTTTDQHGNYKVVIPSKIGNYTITVEKAGLMFKTVRKDLDGKEKNRTTDITLLKPSVSSKIVVRNINYDVNKYNLKPESFVQLNRLVKLLNENPTMEAEIASHTDNQGDDASNLILSQKRSESVVKYLVSKGIQASRLKATGYGEERPIASNDDEKDGRELNRRTEFIVTKL